MFQYGSEALARQTAETKDLGFAGFRLHYPLNRPEYKDEIAVFVGASYFRALAKGNHYGISSRGLALDTACAQGEEFPYFKEFWIERPAPNAKSITVYALMDSPSLAGAYRFVITPGAPTVMDVKCALFARKETLERELERRRQEYEALAIALHTLEKANETMQQRFSPQLNALTSGYFARLTGGKYDRVTLNRELEGQTAQTGAVLPRTELYLSRGTADQLYLAVRLAVCDLCLPQKPPVVLDDALITFDDTRLKLALKLLEELSEGRQILLFTCQKREGEALEELA
jgi:hypothetical protein